MKGGIGMQSKYKNTLSISTSHKQDLLFTQIHIKKICILLCFLPSFNKILQPRINFQNPVPFSLGVLEWMGILPEAFGYLCFVASAIRIHFQWYDGQKLNEQ